MSNINTPPYCENEPQKLNAEQLYQTVMRYYLAESLMNVEPPVDATATMAIIDAIRIFFRNPSKTSEEFLSKFEAKISRDFEKYHNDYGFKTYSNNSPAQLDMFDAKPTLSSEQLAITKEILFLEIVNKSLQKLSDVLQTNLEEINEAHLDLRTKLTNKIAIVTKEYKQKIEELDSLQ